MRKFFLAIAALGVMHVSTLLPPVRRLLYPSSIRVGTVFSVAVTLPGSGLIHVQAQATDSYPQKSTMLWFSVKVKSLEAGGVIWDHDFDDAAHRPSGKALTIKLDEDLPVRFPSGVYHVYIYKRSAESAHDKHCDSMVIQVQ
jgi:hypothetical protein